MKYVYATLSVICGTLFVLILSFYIQLSLGFIKPYPIPIVLENTSEYEVVHTQLLGQDIGTPILGIIFFALFAYFNALYRRLNKRKKGTYRYEEISGPFVLYLRSFVDDAKTSKFVSVLTDYRTEEEHLVEVFSDIAPVYAIGDPKDKNMPNGASRIYVSDEQWKSVVEDLAVRAQLVVLRLGKTDSFWWEVEMALAKVPIEKIVFVVPESKTFNSVASLYKILLDHGINIQNLEVNIEKKHTGSISSLLYFDANKTPYTRTLKVVRFTQWIISYENILRQLLGELRRRYGLSEPKGRTIRWARCCQALLLLYFMFIIGAKTFKDYTSLKNQMPYELVKRCVAHPEFVNKYSHEINGTNLRRCVVEANQGMYALSDYDFLLMYRIRARAYMKMSDAEFEQLAAAPQNLLLMVKKYVGEEAYATYVRLQSEAALWSINHPDEVKSLLQCYRQNKENLPQWVIDLGEATLDYENDAQFKRAFIDEVQKHLDDAGISDVLKTFYIL